MKRRGSPKARPAIICIGVIAIASSLYSNGALKAVNIAYMSNYQTGGNVTTGTAGGGTSASQTNSNETSDDELFTKILGHDANGNTLDDDDDSHEKEQEKEEADTNGIDIDMDMDMDMDMNMDVTGEKKQGETETEHSNSSDSNGKGKGNDKGDELCPAINHIFMQDKVLPENITHTPTRPIPRVLHFFVKSRCMPKDVADNIKQWMALKDHSILIHDLVEIEEYLSKDRSKSESESGLALAFVPKAFKCAFQHEVVLDLARFVWLFDHGGISVDIDFVPGEGFLNGTLLDRSEKNVTQQFVIEDSESHPTPRFIAAAPGHLATFGNILISVAGQYRQHTFNGTRTDYNYQKLRNDIYKKTAQDEFRGKDLNQVITNHVHGRGDSSTSIGIVNTGRTAGKMLLQVNVTKESSESSGLANDKELKQCVVLTDDSYQIDTKALLEVSEGAAGANTSTTCPDGQIYMSNTFIPESVNIPGRKIPKIVHMTSKGKCFEKNVADNADLWKFKDHSFFMHDDAAVQRLFNSKEWTEFPLLQEVLPCLSSGAMKADYWRYLAIWEYGGIYTDMDNAPGYGFLNGTVIGDDHDSFFEVERDGFPSQYFFAVSPHHPVAYFMVQITIERLIYLMNSISKARNAPVVTGPGAVKTAVIAQTGRNYPGKGDYNGVFHRTVNMFGDPRSAKRGVYCRRSAIAGSMDLSKMNMTHYLSTPQGQNGKPSHSCTVELLENTKTNS